MNCEQATEWFGIYRDLPEDAPERLAVDAHTAGCSDCAEQLRLWEESAELIRRLPFEEYTDEEERTWIADTLNRQVMDRIYAEQFWYMPAVRRTYAFSSGFRRKVALLLSMLLAVFGCGFLYSVWNRITGGDAGSRADVESVFGSGEFGVQTVNVPVASLSDPVVLHVSPVMPEYWIALSLLGIIMMLLILNWFSRVRS